MHPENFEVIELPMPSADAVENGGVLCWLQLLSGNPYSSVNRAAAPAAGPSLPDPGAARARCKQARMRNAPGYLIGPSSSNSLWMVAALRRCW